MTLKAIVVGASSGIGAALAKMLSCEGYEVGLASRNVEKLYVVQSGLTSKSWIKKIDLRDPEDAERKIQELIQEMGGLDLMVVNSGINAPDPEWDWKIHWDIVKVNVIGFMVMCEVGLRYFQKKGSGHLVGISSIASLRGNSRAPAYNASKAFVSNYLEGLRQRVDKEVIVTDILPGFVETPMIANLKGTFWVSTAEKAAKQIITAIRKKKRRVYVSRRWLWVGVVYRLLPGWLYDLMIKRFMKKQESVR